MDSIVAGSFTGQQRSMVSLVGLFILAIQHIKQLKNIDMKFTMDVEGVIEAEEFIKGCGKYEEFMNNKTSTDGYSMVRFA